MLVVIQRVSPMAKIYTVANQKGGVGKTTTVVNLGIALAEQGRKVLLVDMDPQGALSINLGGDPDQLEKTVYTVLLDPDFDLREAIVSTELGVDLLPSNLDLSAAEVELISEIGRESILREVLNRVKESYDFVIIDTPPSLGLLTINALVAADEVIIPLQTQFMAAKGITLLLRTISKVRDKLNKNLKVAGILPTMFDGRTLHAKEVVKEIRETFGEAVFGVVIKQSVRFAEAPITGKPLLLYASDHQGAQAYRELAKEIAYGF